MTGGTDKITARAMALAAFHGWVWLNRIPFDATTHQRAYRRHRLQNRPRIEALSRSLVTLAGPALRIVPPLPHAAPPDLPLPRRIWLYWEQGEAAAPDLVKLCLRSWRDLNPGWEVTCLDAGAPILAEIGAVLPPGLRPAHRADVLRLALLDRHGGVWADASALCRAPLDHWLTGRMQEGFFGFALTRAESDRPVDNWFLASTPGAPLTRSWLRHALGYWSSNTEPAHYFVHQYLFDWMLMTNPALARSWARVPTLSATPMHVLQRALKGKSLPLDPATVLADPESYPVQKLDWRLDAELPRLLYMLEQAPPTPSP